MLEKLGLPAKPSLRGSNWVADASHCQGCSSQFTFINRKHHCRRCGGLFCNSCSRNRMVLRGQGDSPVRICEPCKSLEEAARFQARYGRKKGGDASTSTQKDGDGDEVLKQVLCDNSPVTSANPTLLRQQALDEREKYRVFKSEGKADEALKAFKRGKELERKASAMELEIRKNQKKSGSSRSMKEVQNTSKNDADFAAELRDLGWSDLDSQEKNNKQSPSLEDRRGSRKKTHVIDKSQVIALKKKALVLKREGKITEAMEELKKAKLLEKQLEEQEFWADSEDSDDELTSLMRSIDNDDINQQSLVSNFDVEVDFNEIIRMSEHFDLDNLDVTDEDLNDPEITTALENIGWTEDSRGNDSAESEIMSLKREALDRKKEGNIEGAKELLKKAKLLENRSCLDSSEEEAPNGVIDSKPVLRNKLAVQKDLLALKKKALALRREGRYADAEEELKKGRLLEQQLEDMNKTSNAKFSETSDEQHPAEEIDTDVTDGEMHDPAYMKFLNGFGWQNDDEDDLVRIQNMTSTSKKCAERRSKGEMQRELLGLKRKALTLRRQGDVDAAEEMLKMAKILESEMADTESNRVIGNESASIPSPKDEHADVIVIGAIESRPSDATSRRLSSQDRFKLQRECLLHKRQAMKLRRGGEIEEAEAELKLAKALEEQLESSSAVEANSLQTTRWKDEDATVEDVLDPRLLSSLKEVGISDVYDLPEPVSIRVGGNPILDDREKLVKEIKLEKAKAVNLKRLGKQEKALSTLKRAKILERKLQSFESA